jgi:molecular chaperone GrpE
MEKDQNINTENQDTEVNELTSENQDTEVNELTSENQDTEVNELTSKEQNNELKPSINEKNEEVKKITAEEKIKELEDKVARAFAEMENQRRRFEKEREDAFNYGGFAFAKETLNLIDNLERSKQILENDNVLKNTEALKKTLEHFDIIIKDMASILSKNGITPLDSIGKKLDPNFHQAMMEIDDDQKEPGTIVQEIQKGFMMKDRLLRPSLVGVSKKTEKNEEKNKENKENLNN